MERVKIVEWKNVSLVVLEEADTQIMYKWINNINIAKYLWSANNIWTLEREKEYVTSAYKKNDTKVFWIYLNQEEKYIWNIDLFDISLINKNAVLWIVIFDEDSLWKWYWSEAIELILDYWFKVQWLQKVSLWAHLFNTRAIKSYEKVWFKKVWIRKKQNFVLWEFHDDVIMEIFDLEFYENRESKFKI